MNVDILDHQQSAKGALYLKVRLDNGMILHGLRIIFAARGLIVNSPTRPVLDNQGNQKRGERDGARLFAPMLSFESREAGQAFTDAVIAAARMACPEALAQVPRTLPEDE